MDSLTGHKMMNKIPEIDLHIVSFPIEKETRKLKIRWDPKLSQDLDAFSADLEEWGYKNPFPMNNYLYKRDKGKEEYIRN